MTNSDGKLRALRLALKPRKSQRGMAFDFQVDPQTISNWETGQTRPSKRQRAKLANYYGVAVGDLGWEEAECPTT